MNQNQKHILEYLLDHPEGASLEDISSFLQISKSGAKEHIIKLQLNGLIHFTDSKGEIGRPKRSYHLTKEGNEVFPRQYSWLSNELLELLATNMGEAALGILMKKLAAKVADSMSSRFEDKKSSAELLREINVVMNDLGYRSTLKQTDLRKGAILEATNCVYHTVAKTHPVLCKFDIHFLEQASGLNVKLESCIARGGATCRFCLKK